MTNLDQKMAESGKNLLGIAKMLEGYKRQQEGTLEDGAEQISKEEIMGQLNQFADDGATYNTILSNPEEIEDLFGPELREKFDRNTDEKARKAE